MARLVEDAAAGVTAMAEGARQRVARVGRSIGQLARHIGHGGGFEGRPVVTAAPDVHGGMQARARDGRDVDRPRSSRVDVRVENREILAWDQRLDACSYYRPVVEPYAWRTERRDMFRRDHADHRSLYSDDRARTDPVILKAGCEHHDRTVVTAAGCRRGPADAQSEGPGGKRNFPAGEDVPHGSVPIQSCRPEGPTLLSLGLRTYE